MIDSTVRRLSGDCRDCLELVKGPAGRRPPNALRHPETPLLVVECDCGFEATDTEVELILIVQEHASEADNASLTDEQALARVRSV